MISAYTTHSYRPQTGLVAFVRAAAMKPVGGRIDALHLGLPMNLPRFGREDGLAYPGEDGA